MSEKGKAFRKGEKPKKRAKRIIDPLRRTSEIEAACDKFLQGCFGK